MVAGDTKKIVVIKNISSNLIEEAIFILRSEPSSRGDKQKKIGEASSKAGNDTLLKEAENIINQYIKENGWKVTGGRNRGPGSRNARTGLFGISANVLVNGSLLVAVALLLFVICRFL